MHVFMTKNKMFPLDVSTMTGYVLAAKKEDDSLI